MGKEIKSNPISFCGAHLKCVTQYSAAMRVFFTLASSMSSLSLLCESEFFIAFRFFYKHFYYFRAKIFALIFGARRFLSPGGFLMINNLLAHALSFYSNYNTYRSYLLEVVLPV